MNTNTILTHVYTLIKADALLMTYLTGVYKDSLPMARTGVDCVVSILANLSTKHTSQGALLIRIYVPDVDAGGDYVQDFAKCSILEDALKALSDRINTKNVIQLILNSREINTYKNVEMGNSVPNRQEHVVTLKINYLT